MLRCNYFQKAQEVRLILCLPVSEQKPSKYAMKLNKPHRNVPSGCGIKALLRCILKKHFDACVNMYRQLRHLTYFRFESKYLVRFFIV